MPVNFDSRRLREQRRCGSGRIGTARYNDARSFCDRSMIEESRQGDAALSERARLRARRPPVEIATEVRVRPDVGAQRSSTAARAHWVFRLQELKLTDSRERIDSILGSFEKICAIPSEIFANCDY